MKKRAVTSGITIIKVICRRTVIKIAHFYTPPEKNAVIIPQGHQYPRPEVSKNHNEYSIEPYFLWYD